MWSYLSSLPTEIITQHILGSLCLKDFINLDTALLNRIFRKEFQTILPHCPPYTYNRFDNKNIDFKWMKNRKSRILELTCYISKTNFMEISFGQIEHIKIIIDSELTEKHVSQLCTLDHNSKTSLEINSNSYQDSTFVLQLLSHFTNIQEFTVEINHEQEIPWLQQALQTVQCKQSLHFMLHTITQYWADFILNNCNCVQCLYFPLGPRWNIDSTEWLGKLGRTRRISPLNTLMLTTCSDISYSIRCSGIIALVQSYPNIQTLTLYKVNVSDDAITAIATHCTRLKSLSINDAYTFTYKSLIALSKYSTKLEKLSIPWIPIPNAEIAAQCAHALSCIQRITATTNIQYCLPYMKSLTTIYLTNCCTDITLIEIAQYCPTITLISIKNSALLNNTGLVTLSEHCRNLNRFYAENCSQITDRSLNILFQNNVHIEDISLINHAQLTDTTIFT